ncbi:MAG: pyridoxamine 5'-phosphate oxidase family protein [Gammaproteobacteria bacterium]|nr:pyridoxamine 5'-phosphate oxidase family protein [Gammaproteobacteria bacterium]
MSDTRMTAAEREAFLADLHVGVLAIPRPQGAPLTAPIWYAYEPGGAITVITDRESRKGKLLAAGTRVTLVAQTESLPYRYVSVEGLVSDIREADLESDLRPMARRYLGAKGGDAYAEQSGTDGSVMVRIEPQRWLSVDYGKLGA